MYIKKKRKLVMQLQYKLHKNGHNDKANILLEVLLRHVGKPYIFNNRATSKEEMELH